MVQRKLELSASTTEVLPSDGPSLTGLFDALGYVWRVAVKENETRLEASEWQWLKSALDDAVINPRQHPGEALIGALDEAVAYLLVASNPDVQPDILKDKLRALARFDALVMLHTLRAKDVPSPKFWTLEQQMEQRRKASPKPVRKPSKSASDVGSDRDLNSTP